MDKGIKLKMSIKAFIICGCLFILSGCIYNDEPMPEVTFDYISKVVLPTPPVPTPPVPMPTDIHKNIPRDWLPSLEVEKEWTAVVIHHSGTKNGNAAIFDKWHKEGKYWQGVGYDFVIGNGTNSRDGQVEVTYRWRNQKIGAHCGGTPGNWANKDAVGICLVGNFNYTVPTAQQMRSLVKLVHFLQERYRIPKSRIYGHKNTPGARVTDCPGKRFPMVKLNSMLDF